MRHPFVPITVFLVALGLHQAAWAVTEAAATPAAPPQKDAIEYGACLDMARYNPKEAVAAVTSLSKAEQSPAALHCLGIAHSNLGEFAQAAEIFDKLAALLVDEDHRNRAALLGQAGVAYRLAKQPQQALERLLKASKLDPASVDLWLDLSEVYLDMGDKPQALAAMDKALYFAPGHLEALVMRAATRRAAGDQSGAEADVLRALKLDPKDPEALIERSVQLKALNRISTAVMFLRRAKDYARTDDQRMRAQHYLKELLPILKAQQDQAQ